jgi:hypothetical protein
LSLEQWIALTNFIRPIILDRRHGSGRAVRGC